MTYNGYNQYSPYWQQSAGQTSPYSSGQNVTQSRTSYQPLSAYQSNPQTPQSSISQPAENSTGTSYGSQGYGNVGVNGAGSGRPQDFRSSYTNTNDRASLDGATALGNLAYASSLGRDGATQQATDYSRQRSSSNYGTVSPYGTSSAPHIQNWTGDERRESSKPSREDTNARAQQATASPSFGYSSNNTAYQGPSAGNSMQTPPQYSSSNSTSEQHRLNQYSQPPRPTSGQAIQQPHSRPDSRAAPPPAAHTTQSNTYQSQGRNDGGNGLGAQTRVQTPQQSTNRPSSRTSGPPEGHNPKSHARKGTREMGTMHTANSAMKSKTAAHVSAEKTSAKRNGDALQSPSVDVNQRADKPATPVEPQYTTVDPSQVFNHAEYSRRQAAAAAEVAAAKKAAEEVEASRIAATQKKPLQVGGSSVTASAPISEPGSAKKDQMELEMKQMIEKMRDYKANDPSLFTEIWEQVKKSQPPQQAPSQPFQGSATPPVVVNGQLPSPSLIQSQLPSESDLPASGDFPPNVDRGRFPAQRRRRGGGTKTSTGRKSGIPDSSTKPTAQTQDAENQVSPVPPEIAIPTPKVGQIFPDPGSQSMQEAMQQFHKNSKSPVAKAQQIPGSKKQASMSVSEHPPKAPSPTAPPSQPVPAQSAPPPKPGGTYWPESKKTALAEAARKALTSTTPNQGKAITTQEIHELLDQNPSYTQMCEILEYRGFVIDRGQFARTLLKAVPDLGSASSPANAASASSASVNPAASTYATPTNTAPNNDTAKATSSTPTAGSFGKLVNAPSNDSAPQTNTRQLLPHPAPPGGNPSNGLFPFSSQSYHLREYRFVEPKSRFVGAKYSLPGKLYDPSSGTNQGRHEPSSPPYSHHQQSESNNGQAIDQNGTINPNGVIPHPSKQEMARKRNFGEIVNLTTLSDEEELGRHRPRPRTDYESGLGPNTSVINTFDQAVRKQQNDGRSTPKPFKYKYSGRDALLQSYDIIEPMNKRRDALRRSMYNPKTIVRDFLLATGKHPTMAPLNAHLDVLKDRFKAVDNESDLSKFRWDLVDPEVVANMRSTDTDDEEAVPVTHAESRPRPAPMAVMVDVDGAGFAKDDKTSSHMRGPYKKKNIQSGTQPIGSAGTPEGQASQSLPHAQDWNKELGTNSTDLSRFAYNSPNTMQMNFTAPNSSNASTPGTAPKRRGRPPGARNKHVRPDKGIPKKPMTPSTGATPSTAQARPSDEEILHKKPSVGGSTIEKPSTPIPTRPRIDTTTPSKQSGFRNSMSAMTPTDGIAVVIPSRSPSVAVTPQTSAKKGRPKNAEDHTNRTPPSVPAYIVYRCHWENCPAELHNFETLKKHVKKHRRAADGVYPCLWVDCSDSSNPISNNMQSEEGQYQRLKFKTEEEWITHVESNHLRAERKLSAGALGNGSSWDNI